MQIQPVVFPPYTGQSQQRQIAVPATIAYRQAEMEEGPWVMPNYSSIFPEVPNAQTEEIEPVVVPPPIQKTDLWAAQQLFPL